VKVEVGFKFEITFLTQHLGMSIFYPNLDSNNPTLFRVYAFKINTLHSKNCWVVLNQIWVKYGQTQQLGYIFYYIFNPMFGFVHI